MSLDTIPPPVVYPDSDGKPMADNTEQFRWIQILSGNLAALYADDPNVFVGGNLLWYPIQGDADTRYAPDVFVVFGRPKGYRGSYKQWEENGIPMTVVFEIRSPSNSDEEMREKLLAYEDFEVEEYYFYNPEKNELLAYHRGKAALVPIHFGNELTSPRLGIRFDLSGPEMRVSYPNGKPFESMEQVQKRADNEAKRADNEAKRAARLGQLALKASRGQLSAEEQHELEMLANPSQSG